MIKKQLYESDSVDLRIREVIPVSFFNRSPKSIVYSIYRHGDYECIGECDLRFGMDEELYYAGNIGYRIYDGFRGHHYAYYACQLLLQIAKEEYRFRNVIITCSPDNIASDKTIQSLHAELLQTVNVPKRHWLYRRGEKVKNIYLLTL